MQMKINFSIIGVMIMMIWSAPIIHIEAASDEAKWSKWSYSIPIQIEGSSQYKSVFLTEAIYEHTLKNLADVRIIDKQGTAIPYYIQNGETVAEKSKLIYTSLLNATKQVKNDTMLDFKINSIHENGDIIGNELEFSLPDTNFLKHLLIFGSYDGDQWDLVGKDYIYRADHLQKNEVQLGQAYKYNYYRVKMIDNAERILLSKMELIYNVESSRLKDFEKTASLDYEIFNEEKETVIALENPQRLKVSTIHLDISGNFQRSYRLFGSDQHEIGGMEELYNLSFQNSQISNTSISLDQSPISDQEITIKIANQDNPPLNIQDIKISYQIDKIVFEDQGNAPYHLYYGNPQAQQPQYDVQQFQNYIEQEKQDVLNLGQPEKLIQKPTDQNTLNLKMIFNSIVVVISILLALFLLNKLNKNKS